MSVHPRISSHAPRSGAIHGSQGDTPVQLITRQPELDEFTQRIRDLGRFAFDTEFIMEDRFSREVCLAQLATESAVAVVDPMTGIDFDPIWTLVADHDVETIVHAGMEDMALCFEVGGKLPQNVFDCQIACGLVTPDYPLSLSRMVKNLLRVRLRKSQTLTDWRRRPLSDEQIQYAAADVVYLPSIHRTIQKRLEKHSRTDWLAEEMVKFSQATTYQRGPEAETFKLKGAGGLDARGLAVARELVKVRESLARDLNRPVRAVLRDHLVIEIAKHRWTSVKQIRKLRGMNLRTAAVQQLGAAVQRACQIPDEECPKTPTSMEETDEEAALALLVAAVIRAYCSRHEIAHQLVASRQTAREFVHNMVRREVDAVPTALETGWRAESVGRVLRSLLNGTARITIHNEGTVRTLVVDHD